MKALRELYHIHPAQRNGKKLKKEKRPERLARFERQWPGAPFSARGTRAKKGPAASYSRTGGSRTTLGDEALDFGVRNGNRYDCLSVATGLKRPSVGD